MNAAFANPQTSPLRKEVNATLVFLEKIVLHHEALQEADLLPLKELGLSDEAIEEGIQVCSVFNTVNRIADALEFRIPPDKVFTKHAPIMYKRGYKT